MLAIKLKLVGRRNQRTFRVIVQEARAKVGGKFVEDLGWYNPHTNQFKVNKTRADYWVGNGAQPTDSVASLLKKVRSSETGSYEAREGRKRKKGVKGKAEQQADAGLTDTGAEGENPAEQASEAAAGAETATEEKAEASPGEQKEEMSPAEGGEETKEEAPAGESKEEKREEK